MSSGYEKLCGTEVQAFNNSSKNMWKCVAQA